MDGTVESDPESKEEHIAQQTGQEEADEVERGSEAGGRDGDPMEEQRADDDGEGGSGRGRSASEVPPSEFSDGVPHGGEHEQHRPAAATRRPRDRVQSWYRWKKRCKNAIKAGLEKHEGLALFCTLSPHGRWQTRGSQSLIGDPAFPVIEQQLQRLAAAKHELGAARAGIFQNATQRRRGERVAAAEVAAQPESGCNAENQRRPSKVVRAKARRIGKSVGFQRKLQSVLDGAKACNKDVCRAEHQTALTDAPCYPFRQAMGWPDSVPFSTALGELTTREQSDFVAAFAPYEDLQPMDEGEQAGRGEPGQQTTRNAQMPAGKR